MIGKAISPLLLDRVTICIAQIKLTKQPRWQWLSGQGFVCFNVEAPGLIASGFFRLFLFGNFDHTGGTSDLVFCYYSINISLISEIGLRFNV